MSCKCHTTCFKKKGPGFCNICLHIDKKFTSRTRIARLPNPHFHDQRVAVRMHERSYIHVYPRILYKDSEIHCTPWFTVAESPSKNTDVQCFNLSKRVFLDRCAPVLPSSLPAIFHRSRATLVRKQGEKCVSRFWKLHRPLSSPVIVLASFCHSKRMHLHSYCPDTAKL